MKYKNGEKFYRICASNGKVSELSVELVYKINGVTGGEGKYKNEEQFEKFIKENNITNDFEKIKVYKIGLLEKELGIKLNEE